MKNLTKNLILTCTAIFGLTFTSCSSNDEPAVTDTPVVTPTTHSVNLKTDATHGSILIDKDEKSLYFFSKDTKNTSECAGDCLTNWPIFYSENITVGTGLSSADFSEITRADGSKQSTYKGWPLYYYANDTAAGNTNGDNVGNVWFIAKPDYSLMYVNAQLVGNDGNNYTSSYEIGDGATSYIVDFEGKTLYAFANDKNNTNNYTAADLSNNNTWPIAEITLDKVPSVLNLADFGTISVHGKTQLTYKGWPLYYFGADTARGDNKGASAIWPIVNTSTTVAPAPAVTLEPYNVTNSGATAYLLSGNGLSSSSNPNITLKRGETYTFPIHSPGHPFIIKTAEGTGTSNMYNNGVTNNRTSSGTITFTVPSDAPDTLYYVCEFHSSMKGRITIMN